MRLTDLIEHICQNGLSVLEDVCFLAIEHISIPDIICCNVCFIQQYTIIFLHLQLIIMATAIQSLKQLVK